MYCPKCSQQQISPEVRFCPRCGFQLAAVAELLLSDGVLMLRPQESGGVISALRQKGALTGAKIMFFSVFLALPAFVLSLALDSPGPLLAVLLPFVIGLAQFLYAFIFGESGPATHQTTLLSTPPAQPFTAFPSYSAPVPLTGTKRIDTAEILPPLSVTEHTTKFLEK